MEGNTFLKTTEEQKCYLNLLAEKVSLEGDEIKRVNSCDIDGILYKNVFFCVDEERKEIATWTIFPNGNCSMTRYLLESKQCREANFFEDGKICYLEPLTYLFSFLFCMKKKDVGYTDDEVERIRKIWYQKNLRKVKEERLCILQEEFEAEKTSFNFMEKMDETINPFLSGKKFNVEEFVKKNDFRGNLDENFSWNPSGNSDVFNWFFANASWVEYDTFQVIDKVHHKLKHFIYNIDEESNDPVCNYYKKIGVREKISYFINTNEFSLLKTEDTVFCIENNKPMRVASTDDEEKFKQILRDIFKIES